MTRIRYVHDEYQRLNHRLVAGNTTFVARSSAPEMVGQWFAETFVMQQLLLLVLATPAFVAGAITEEKRRGTLQYLPTTDLEARHIILGKLLARRQASGGRDEQLFHASPQGSGKICNIYTSSRSLSRHLAEAINSLSSSS